MQIKNLSLIWMVKHFTSNKSITIRLYYLKNSLDFIVAIGLSMIPKGPESLIRKSLKTLVNKCLRICTMVTMRQFLPMVKPVQESPVQFKVSQAQNQKDSCNYVSKMCSEEKNKTNQKMLQQLSESLICKFTMKNLKIFFQKIRKIIKQK